MTAPSKNKKRRMEQRRFRSFDIGEADGDSSSIIIYLIIPIFIRIVNNFFVFSTKTSRFFFKKEEKGIKTRSDGRE